MNHTLWIPFPYKFILTMVKYCDRKSNEEENINSLRKELLHQYQDQDQGGNWNIENFNNNVKDRQSLYVKVKMEGVAIGRKIDLRLFDSYQALKRTLLNMFTKCKIPSLKKHLAVA